MLRNLTKSFSRSTLERVVCVPGKRVFSVKLPRRTDSNLQVVARSLHTCSQDLAKNFIDRENTYAFNVIEGINGFTRPKLEREIPNTVTTLAEFTSFMNQDFRKKSSKEIVAAFTTVVQFCKSGRIDVSDSRFDRLTDGLIDNVEKLLDDELLMVLDLLAEFPQCSSFKSHNFHDIWSALDDVCCWRISEWDKNKLFVVADKWYRLNLGKVCDFIYEVLEKLSRRPRSLTKNELVHAFFYMNVCRKRGMDFELESAVEHKIEDMTVDEAAVVALGYFKTQNKVKIPLVCSVMLRKAREAKDIHEITLCAILKTVRFSSHPNISDQISEFLDYITPKMDKFSTLCLLHVALLGTTLQIEHKPSMGVAAQRIAELADDVGEVRLKDLERILLPLSMFDFDPGTKPDVYNVAFREMHEERRRKEMAQYPRCMPSALHYLSIRNIYSYELMNQILHPDFIVQTYGKPSKLLPREVFSLDVSIDIECPDYRGSKLDPVTRRKAAKWLTVFTPTHDQRKRITKADGLVLDAIETVSQMCGGVEYYLIEHVLPHFIRADIIVCKDISGGKFVRPEGLEGYVLGDVMRPPLTDANLKWYAVVVVGLNNTIRNSSRTLGSTNMKMRQLEKIGYMPVTVIWNKFLPLSKSDRVAYILNKL